MTSSRNERKTSSAASRRSALGIVVVFGCAVLWAYWTSLAEMADRWGRDPEYSHGYLVPIFSLGILWLRRDLLDADDLRPSWWGLPFFAAAFALRYAGARYYVNWFDSLSLIPCLMGVGLSAAGWRAARWFWPSVVFLFFMMPLPYSAEVALRDPLRRLGTLAGTYLMQTIGLPAVADGTIITVGDVRIGVVEACSGLRMLMIFFALATAVALLCRRPLRERLLIVLSAVPIAIVVNVARLTLTGVLYAQKLGELADMVFHDLAGWLMMPAGLALLAAELWFLSRLFVVEDRAPLGVVLAPALRTPAGAADAITPRRSRLRS